MCGNVRVYAVHGPLLICGIGHLGYRGETARLPQWRTLILILHRLYVLAAHRFVSNQLPNLLERYLRRANQQLFLPLGDFVQSEGAGVDIYVVG